MIQFTKEEKIRAYKLLTPAEKSTTDSDSIGEKIKVVANKYNLTEENFQVFRFTIGQYCLKLIKESDFLQIFTERFPEQPVTNLLNDVKEIIFPEIEKVKREYRPKPEKDEYSVEENNSEEILNPQKSPKSLTRDDYLKAIENPVTIDNRNNTSEPPTNLPGAETDKYREPVSSATTPTLARNPFEEKLKGIVFTPKETKNVVIESPKPKIPADNTPKTPNTPKYQGSDPYREPI